MNKNTIFIQAILCLLLSSFFTLQINLAQNTEGRVGIGTTDPQAKLHVAGDIQVDELSGNGDRTLVATPDGKLKAVANSEPNPSIGDTIRAKFIELVDDEGDTKFIFNAHTGEFQMMDEDTVWYEIEVKSPPKIKIRTEKGEIISSSEESDIEAFKEVFEVLLEAAEESVPNAAEIKDVISNGEIERIEGNVNTQTANVFNIVQKGFYDVIVLKDGKKMRITMFVDANLSPFGFVPFLSSVLIDGQEPISFFRNIVSNDEGVTETITQKNAKRTQINTVKKTDNQGNEVNQPQTEIFEGVNVNGQVVNTFTDFLKAVKNTQGADGNTVENTETGDQIQSGINSNGKAETKITNPTEGKEQTSNASKTSFTNTQNQSKLEQGLDEVNQPFVAFLDSNGNEVGKIAVGEFQEPFISFVSDTDIVDFNPHQINFSQKFNSPNQAGLGINEFNNPFVSLSNQNSNILFTPDNITAQDKNTGSATVTSFSELVGVVNQTNTNTNNIQQNTTNIQQNTTNIQQNSNAIQDLQNNSGGGGTGSTTANKFTASENGSTNELKPEKTEINAADGNKAEFKKDGILLTAPDGTQFFIDCFGLSKLKTGKSLGFAGLSLDADNDKVVVDVDLEVFGTITEVGKKITKIDHPTDPTNQYLQHSFVGTDELLNEYSGNATTNSNGFATVSLPEYIQAYNKDFRYQLTVIRTFAQAIVAEEIANNQFVIQTNEPNVKVSWQITGVRNDVYAQQNPLQVEVNKEGTAKGKVLYDANIQGFTQTVERKAVLQQEASTANVE